MPPSSTRISLALQGGGTHSAFAWGAVDQLLIDERVEIDAISGTSGGAMIAVILAQGMLENGRRGARDALQSFWKKVSIAAGLLPIKLSPVDKFLSGVGIDLAPSTVALDYLTRVFSPYQFNLFDINPLRGIVEEMVDFRVLSRKCPLPVYINATHVTTGESRIFEAKELSLDAVMASACLPFIFKTVMIDGEPYWDGSLSGCPPLAPLLEAKRVSDIALVRVHPARADDVPTAATDILDRALEISFSAVLARDIAAAEKKNARIHIIEADDTLVSLGRASKLNADWNFLVHLHDLGVQAATDWLDKKRLFS